MQMSLIQMTPEEAITLTHTITSTVATVTQDLSDQGVTNQVMEAAKALAQAAAPLSNVPTLSHELRMDIDNAADSVIAGIHNILQGKLQIYTQKEVPLLPAEQDENHAAQELLDLLFPQGTGFLRENWSQQYGATDILLARLEGKEAQQKATLLGLELPFGLLQRIHKEYGIRMGFTQTSTDTKDNLLRDWYESLERYMAAVTLNHKRDSAARVQLHAPYYTLESKIRERQRKARQMAALRREDSQNNTDTSVPSPAPAVAPTTTQSPVSIANPPTIAIANPPTIATAAVPTVPNPANPTK